MADTASPDLDSDGDSEQSLRPGTSPAAPNPGRPAARAAGEPDWERPRSYSSGYHCPSPTSRRLGVHRDPKARRDWQLLAMYYGNNFECRLLSSLAIAVQFASGGLGSPTSAGIPRPVDSNPIQVPGMIVDLESVPVEFRKRKK